MALGFALNAGVAPDVIKAAAREAEASGYTSFWVNHPGSTDGLASLGAAAKETQKIALGVGVIPLHTRGSEDIANGVTTQALPLDRLLLGVGSPNPGALARVRAGIADLRSRVKTRLIIAALGPQMCKLAGEIGDGVLLNWVTPEYARRSADLVREGAATAKRPTPTIFVYVRLALGAASHDRLLTEAKRYASVPAYGANFDRMGVKPETTAIAAHTPADIKTALAKWAGVVDEVVLRSITVNDAVDETLALVRAARP